MSGSQFQNKVVVVSGAGRGIGRTIALSFAAQGAKLALFDKDSELCDDLEQELSKLDIPHMVSNFDINETEKLSQFIEQVKTELGQIDVLINNVGYGVGRRFKETSPSDYQSVMNTNFGGAFMLTKIVEPAMNDGANIIFISSIHAIQPSLDPVYDASKAAINNLVLNLAISLSQRNIRVNAITPGHIDVSGVEDPRFQSDVFLGKKAGLPEDVANACLFLADNIQARYITGVILPVSGGIHIPISRDLEV